ncbi:MAG: hypothetical protein FWC22_08330 [Treponema sp.]|nr:hypothetical protein [Treponema sp.]
MTEQEIIQDLQIRVLFFEDNIVKLADYIETLKFIANDESNLWFSEVKKIKERLINL